MNQIKLMTQNTKHKSNKSKHSIKTALYLNRIGALCATGSCIFHRKFDSPSLEVDDDEKHGKCRSQVGQVGHVCSRKCFLDRTEFGTTCDEEVEEGNECAFEFRSTSSVHRRWGKTIWFNIEISQRYIKKKL